MVNQIKINEFILKLYSKSPQILTIPIPELKHICGKKKLPSQIIKLLLTYIKKENLVNQEELLTSLVKNKNLEMDSRIEALEILYKLKSTNTNLIQKQLLANELLSLTSAGSKNYIDIRYLLSRFEYKNMKFSNPTHMIPTGLPSSKELDILKGTLLNSEKTNPNKEIRSVQFDNTLIKARIISYNELSDYLKKTSSSFVRKRIEDKLRQPWGCTLKQIETLVKNVGFNGGSEIEVSDKDFIELLKQYFSFQMLFNQLTSKPLLAAIDLPPNFNDWKKTYGTSFYASSRQFVPSEFLNNWLIYQSMINLISPSFLFLRKYFGLKVASENLNILSLIFFIKTPKRKKISTGRYILTIFIKHKNEKRIIKFLEFTKLEDYLGTFGKKYVGKFGESTDLKHCYVKEFETIEDLRELFSYFMCEILYQYLEQRKINLRRVNTPYPPKELAMRKTNLEIIQQKKILIRKRLERSSLIHCINCNQPLTDKISKLRGYGPECWRKFQHIKIRQSDMRNSVDILERDTQLNFEEWLMRVDAFASSFFGVSRRKSTIVGRKS